MNAAAVADQLYLYPDVLFRADGAVELLNQTIQRGIHLAAIDMPVSYTHLTLPTT